MLAIHDPTLPRARIKGCGQRDVALSFYRIRVRTKTAEQLGTLACGQAAATTGGRPGMLLCDEGAKVNRIVVSGRLVVKQNLPGQRKSSSVA